MKQNWQAYPSELATFSAIIHKDQNPGIILILTNNLAQRDSLLRETNTQFPDKHHLTWIWPKQENPNIPQSFSKVAAEVDKNINPLIHLPHAEQYFFRDYLANNQDTIKNFSNFLTSQSGAWPGYLIIWTDLHVGEHIAGECQGMIKEKIIIPESNTLALEDELSPLPNAIAVEAEIADLYHKHARNFSISGEPCKALAHYGQAIEIWKELADDRILKSYFNVGLIFQQYEWWDQALHYFKLTSDYQKVETLPEDIREIPFKSMHQRGKIYLLQKKWDRSREFLLKASTLFEQLNKQEEIAEIYRDLSVLNVYIQNNDEAILYGKKVIKILNEHHPENIHAEDFTQLARLLERKGKLEEAIQLYHKAIKMTSEDEDPHFIAKSYQQIGAIRQNQFKYQEAQEAFQRAYELVKDSEDDFFVSALSDSIEELMPKVKKKKGFWGNVFRKA